MSKKISLMEANIQIGEAEEAYTKIKKINYLEKILDPELVVIELKDPELEWTFLRDRISDKYTFTTSTLRFTADLYPNNRNVSTYLPQLRVRLSGQIDKPGLVTNIPEVRKLYELIERKMRKDIIEKEANDLIAY